VNRDGLREAAAIAAYGELTASPRRRVPQVRNWRRVTDAWTHGRYGTYTSGCRCDECRNASRVYKAALRARAARFTPSAPQGMDAKVIT
jgi:hypothetical protein